MIEVTKVKLTHPVLFFCSKRERCQGREASRCAGSRSERPKGGEQRRPLTSEDNAPHPLPRRANAPIGVHRPLVNQEEACPRTVTRGHKILILLPQPENTAHRGLVRRGVRFYTCRRGKRPQKAVFFVCEQAQGASRYYLTCLELVPY